jgi:hypothetical protein
MKRNTNSLSRRVGNEHVTATPKAKQNFQSKTKAEPFFYSRHVAAPTQLPAMQQDTKTSLGWPVASPKTKSSPRKLKSECPLTTKGKFKKTRNVHALSLSLFLIRLSTGDSPGEESSRRNQYISA